MKLRFCVALAVFLPLLVASGVAKQPEDTRKNVHGFVLGQGDVPLPSAIVFLKNLRSKSVESRIADKDGAYRYSGLPQNYDFEIWAEYKGVKSDSKPLSSMDTRTDIEWQLHIDVAK